MSELEHQLKQLEVNVAQQFGELDSDDVDDDGDNDDDKDEDDLKCNGTAVAAVNAAADNFKEKEEDFVLNDSLYCIACKKAFKSDRASVCTVFSITAAKRNIKCD